jgi:DNA polymerase-3 subunit epsilon
LRQIVLDTETTGLNAKLGDRIIEIGCIELLNRRISERSFHAYLNPEREVELGATRVHGLTREDLAAKPKFAQIAPDFLNMELEMARLGRLQDHVTAIIDTLLFARELHPGKRNSLDALCERYAIDHSSRTLHGALADARLLAECYLAMTRGQDSLMMDLEAPAEAAGAAASLALDVSKLAVQRASPEELAAHEQFLDAMERDAKGPSVWRRILGTA